MLQQDSERIHGGANPRLVGLANCQSRQTITHNQSRLIELWVVMERHGRRVKGLAVQQ